MAASVKSAGTALFLMLAGVAAPPVADVRLAQPAHAAQSAQSADAAQVEAIRVRLFRERSGTFSHDVIETGEGFWNVIINEDPSDSFLITVVVRGKPDTYDKTACSMTRPGKSSPSGATPAACCSPPMAAAASRSWSTTRTARPSALPPAATRGPRR
jgi:hypothetical protein